MDYQTRRGFLVTAGAVGVASLAGCVGNGGGQSPDGSAAVDVASTQSTDDSSGSPSDESTSGTAGADPAVHPPVAADRLPLAHDLGKFRKNVESGGQPKDGIPSIDDPKFVSPAKGDEFVDPGDVVFGVAGDDEVKAYPQAILVWHEVVNDDLDGQPVSVTYCPLTGTAMGFDRGNTEFGVSGNLLNNNLVMYDRNTDSWWPQILGTAIRGDFEARSLREFRVVWTTWEQWKGRYPDTEILSERTGHARNYQRDPYGRYNPKRGYYNSTRTLFSTLNDDDRYKPKTVVMGARVPTGAIAFHKESLATAGVLDGEIDGVTHSAVYDDRLDTAYVYRNPEGVALSLDGETATLNGESHDPDALPLDRVHAFDAMWFAWAGFYPETVVVE
ncbi:MAG: hypothetical protein ACI9PP_001581 [Halobacteriales archaeon]|jgi:hypothetical protein